jgi:crotonobetainyl-CoA:carnitine CoA-transferase CaiB-like acyl-CoA transferase
VIASATTTVLATRGRSPARSYLTGCAIIERDRAEWLPRLDGFNAPWTFAQDPYEAAADPALRESGSILPVSGGRAHVHHLVALPVRFDESAPKTLVRAPDLGEHSDEILRELGYDQHDVSDLRTRGAVS